MCLLVIAAVCLGACTTRIGGKQTLEQANDALRAENAALREQAKSLEARNAELLAATKVARLPGIADCFNPSEVMQATPIVTSIEIDRLSGARSDDPRTFTVYVRTLDGLQRFTQAVGKLSIALRNSKSETPMQTRLLLPVPLREAYRSGFAGTSYVIPIQLLPTQKAEEIDLIQATFTDAHSGQIISGELKIAK